MHTAQIDMKFILESISIFCVFDFERIDICFNVMNSAKVSLSIKVIN